MEHLLEIFNDLKNHSGRNDKEKILEKNKDNELFREVLRFVYNPYIVTGISTKKMKKKVKVSVNHDLSNINEVMDYLRVHNSGRDYDIAVVQKFIDKLETEELKEFTRQIITKSLKCGLTEKTINKVYGKGEIPSFAVMLAEKYQDKEVKIKGKFYITLKLDGLRCVAIKENDTVKFFTRAGQPIEGLVELEEEFEHFPNGFMFDGELLLLINKDNLSSNELFRATQKVARKDGIKRNLELNVFDVLPIDEFKAGKSKKVYSERREQLESLFSYFADESVKHIKLLPVLYQGEDKNVIPALMKWVEENGYEGLMLNTDDFYVTKRTDALLKIKRFHSFDGIVMGVYEGTGKNKGKLGGVVITFKDTMVRVGSGFSDKERELYWNNPDEVIGKVAEVSYFEESENQNGGKDLRFATWKGIRHDKAVDDVNYE